MTEREQAIRALAQEFASTFMRKLAKEIDTVGDPDVVIDASVAILASGIESRLREVFAEPAAQLVAERDAATAKLTSMLEREMPPAVAADLIGLHKELEAAKAERDALLAEREQGWLAEAIEDARQRSAEIPPWAKSANGPQQEVEDWSEGVVVDSLGQHDRAVKVVAAPGQLAALQRALEEYGKHSRSCKFDTPEIKCPQCSGPLRSVPKSPSLNTDQWDAVKAGDYYCESCKGERGNTGYRYFNREELPKRPCSCGLAAALATGAGKAEEIQNERLEACECGASEIELDHEYSVSTTDDGDVTPCDHCGRDRRVLRGHALALAEREEERAAQSLLGGGSAEVERGSEEGVHVPLARAAIAWADKKARFKAAAAAAESRQNAQSQSDWMEALHDIKAAEERLLGEVENLLGVRREDIDDPEYIARAIQRRKEEGGDDA